MDELQEQSTLSWIEVQFLAKAVETLGRVRTVLKWTYAMAFYLEKNNQTQMFEDNQKCVNATLGHGLLGPSLGKRTCVLTLL